MSAFGGLVLTNRGKILQSKAQTGVLLKYTRIALGDGNLGTSSILELNALRNEVKSLSITELKVYGNGRAAVRTALRPQDVTSGFYFREIGVFATDPDIGEILYCYGNAGNLAEYIPAGGIDTIEKSIEVQTIIGNASNVSAVLDSIIYETLEGAQGKANQAESNAKTYTDSKITQTETHIDEVIALVEQDIGIYKSETSSTIKSLTKNIIGLALEVETLKHANLSGVDANIFVEQFANLNDVTLTSGLHDAAGEKIYLA